MEDVLIFNPFSINFAFNNLNSSFFIEDVERMVLRVGGNTECNVFKYSSVGCLQPGLKVIFLVPFFFRSRTFGL